MLALLVAMIYFKLMLIANNKTLSVYYLNHYNIFSPIFTYLPFSLFFLIRLLSHFFLYILNIIISLILTKFCLKSLYNSYLKGRWSNFGHRILSLLFIYLSLFFLSLSIYRFALSHVSPPFQTLTSLLFYPNFAYNHYISCLKGRWSKFLAWSWIL